MTDWHEYFREMRERAERGDAAVEDEPTELLVPWTPAIPSSAPAAPKRIHMRLSVAGWEVWLEQSRERVGRKFYMADSKDKDAAGEPVHSRGELKSEAQEVTHWQIRARLMRRGQIVAALQVIWTQKKSCTFTDALIWDAVTKNKEMLTRMGDLNEWLDVFAPVDKKDAA